jgi:hypothetical protein
MYIHKPLLSSHLVLLDTLSYIGDQQTRFSAVPKGKMGPGSRDQEMLVGCCEPGQVVVGTTTSLGLIPVLVFL